MIRMRGSKLLPTSDRTLTRFQEIRDLSPAAQEGHDDPRIEMDTRTLHEVGESVLFGRSPLVRALGRPACPESAAEHAAVWRHRDFRTAPLNHQARRDLGGVYLRDRSEFPRNRVSQKWATTC